MPIGQMGTDKNMTSSRLFAVQGLHATIARPRN